MIPTTYRLIPDDVSSGMHQPLAISLPGTSLQRDCGSLAIRENTFSIRLQHILQKRIEASGRAFSHDRCFSPRQRFLNGGVSTDVQNDCRARVRIVAQEFFRIPIQAFFASLKLKADSGDLAVLPDFKNSVRIILHECHHRILAGKLLASLKHILRVVSRYRLKSVKTFSYLHKLNVVLHRIALTKTLNDPKAIPLTHNLKRSWCDRIHRQAIPSRRTNNMPIDESVLFKFYQSP